jgi:hypothetical protein
VIDSLQRKQDQTTPAGLSSQPNYSNYSQISPKIIIPTQSKQSNSSSCLCKSLCTCLQLIFVLKNNSRLNVSHSPSDRCRKMSEIFVFVQILLVAVDVVLFCCCIFGNAVVIYVICRDKKLKSKSSYHILSVAVADFIVGIFIIPFNLVTVSRQFFIGRSI